MNTDNKSDTPAQGKLPEDLPFTELPSHEAALGHLGRIVDGDDAAAGFDPSKVGQDKYEPRIRSRMKHRVVVELGLISLDDAMDIAKQVAVLVKQMAEMKNIGVEVTHESKSVVG